MEPIQAVLPELQHLVGVARYNLWRAVNLAGRDVRFEALEDDLYLLLGELQRIEADLLRRKR